MAATAVEVVAPSRLHFGLLSFGQRGVRQFGGAGAMIDRPGLRLRIAPGSELEVAGPLAERVRAVVRRYAQYRELAGLPPRRIEVLDAPPEHVGLGTGTQLSLAVVAGLLALESGETALEALDWNQLITIAGRAARSAVGTYGFALGGLVMEEGKLAGEALSPLEYRVDLPAAWRFVLVVPGQERGLSGDAEQLAFDNLPPVPEETTANLRCELVDRLFPAAESGDFERFGESLYRYGHAAGMCFAPRQGGPFAGAKVAALVQALRDWGVRGVGQTSWGPTVFALADSQTSAEALATQLRGLVAADDTIVIAPPNNSGARIAFIS